MLNRNITFSPRAYHALIEQVLRLGDIASPRGLTTWELMNATLTVKNPIDRIITDPGRRMNLAFAFAEWYSMMFGNDNIEFFQRFIADYDKFSSDGKKLDGAYGSRLHYNPVMVKSSAVMYSGSRLSQIDSIIKLLNEDQSTRRAVMAIYDADDLVAGRGGINTPCTLTLQFLIRDSQLHMIVNMRSSDVVRGLTYDMFMFTLIQEHIARRVGVRLGSYIHNAASLHFYETDMPLYDRLTRRRWPFLMEPMPRIDDFELMCMRELIGDGEGLDDPSFFTKEALTLPDTLAGQYLSDIAYVMKAYNDRKKDPSLSSLAYHEIRNGTLRHMLRPHLVSVGVLKDRGSHVKETAATA